MKTLKFDVNKLDEASLQEVVYQTLKTARLVSHPEDIRYSLLRPYKGETEAIADGSIYHDQARKFEFRARVKDGIICVWPVGSVSDTLFDADYEV